MGTDRFREDVSESVKKFRREQSGRVPQVLKVNYQDAMTWHAAEQSKFSIDDFVTRQVGTYVNTVPWKKSTLRCETDLLACGDETPTRFE